jgi:tetratricopeptide (TPR) repeat protein
VLRDHRLVPQQLDAASSSPQPSQEAVGERRGLDPLDEAVRLHDLAVTRQAKGRFHEALPLCRQALVIVECAVGPHHPDVANLLNTLAGLYEDLGDHVEAERLAQRSVVLMEEVTGSLELEVLRLQSLGTLAGIYRVQGRYAEAEPLFRRALALAEAALGADDLEVATCLNNLEVLYKYTGRFAKAQRLYRRALAIKEQALGPDHPDVAMTLNNLAILYKAAGKYAEAEPLYQRALAIFEAALGPTHPKVRTCRQNYAQLMREKQRQAKAAALEGHGKRTQISRARRPKKE